MCRDAFFTRAPFLAMVFAAALGLAVTPAPAQQRTTLTRKERPLASIPFNSYDARSVVVSPDGLRGAYVRPLKGGSFVVVIDGNSSQQPYDRVGRNVVTFGPDSRRTAFAGSRGGSWYAVVDGEEGEPFDFVAGDSVTFSPDGWHVAYLAERDGKTCVVADGTTGAMYDGVAEGSIAFSADGQRLAYAARSGGREFVVVNAAEGKPYDTVGRPRFSPDGRRLAFAATAGGKSFVVLDGKEGKAYDAGAGDGGPVHPVSLTFSPDGQRLAYVVGPAGKMRAVVDGAEGKPYGHVFDNSVTFSPDGRRIAYVAKRLGAGDAPAAVVVVDEKESRPQQAVVPGCVRFSADGRRFVYLAERAGAHGIVRRVAVVDGAEGQPYDWLREAPIFSPDGRHFAYVAQRRRAPGGATGETLGPPLPPLPPGQVEHNRLPPRRAAAAPGNPAPVAAPPPADPQSQPQPGPDVASYESFVVVDGIEAAPYPWVRGDLRFALDGTRLAYVAAAADERFGEAGETPSDPTNPAAGVRLVFEKTKADHSYSPGQVRQPVKLLLVEEHLAAE